MTGQALGGEPREIPAATVARLAIYLRLLTSRPAAAESVVSSAELAAGAGVNPAGLRRDLSYLGAAGTRGVGYEVRSLTDRITAALGANVAYRVAVVGLGHLGQALAGYAGFAERGLSIAGLFDDDPAKIGRLVAGLPIREVSSLSAYCRAGKLAIGIIATPESAAQRVADLLVQGGVSSILNFAPAVITVPDEVELRRVDLALELQILAFGQHRRASAS